MKKIVLSAAGAVLIFLSSCSAATQATPKDGYMEAQYLKTLHSQNLPAKYDSEWIYFGRRACRLDTADWIFDTQGTGLTPTASASIYINANVYLCPKEK